MTADWKQSWGWTTVWLQEHGREGSLFYPERGRRVWKGPGSTGLARVQAFLPLSVHGSGVSINLMQDQVGAVSGGPLLITHAPVCTCAQ